MAAGILSPLAFWAGGAGAVAPAPAAAGVRSLLAPWLGGAGAAETDTSQASVRGLFAFWMGGAGAVTTTPPGPTPQPGGIWHQQLRLPIPPTLTERLRLQQIQEDEVIAIVLTAALPVLLRRQ